MSDVSVETQTLCFCRFLVTFHGNGTKSAKVKYAAPQRWILRAEQPTGLSVGLSLRVRFDFEISSLSLERKHFL